MPVIGHAFVGLALGAATYAPGRSMRPQVSRDMAARWLLGATLFSYAPDVIAQTLALVVSPATARLAGHSVFTALATAMAVTGVAAIRRGEYRRALWAGGAVLGLMLLHDALDLLQAADRAPLWPLSAAVVGPATPLLQRRLSTEFLLFAPLVPLAAVIAWRRDPAALRAVFSAWRVTWAAATLGALLSAGFLLHRLHRERDAHASEAMRLVNAGDTAGALAEVARAERWPTAVNPAHMDYVRAAVQWRRGNVADAKRLYLESRAEDPTYLWTVVDLIELCRATESPAGVKACAAPWLTELHSHRWNEPEADEVIRRVDLTLGSAP